MTPADIRKLADLCENTGHACNQRIASTKACAHAAPVLRACADVVEAAKDISDEYLPNGPLNTALAKLEEIAP